MKTRNGFVSNSSSTSFCIVFKDRKKVACPSCGHTPQNILDIINNNNYPYSEVRVDNKKDVLDYIKSHFDYEGDTETMNRYMKNIELYVEDGWKPAVISVDYDDINVTETIQELDKRNELHIVFKLE